jgi:hypothetical protein
VTANCVETYPKFSSFIPGDLKDQGEKDGPYNLFTERSVITTLQFNLNKQSNMAYL